MLNREHLQLPWNKISAALEGDILEDKIRAVERDRFVKLFTETSAEDRAAMMKAAAEFLDGWYGANQWPLRGMDSTIVSFLRSAYFRSLVRNMQ